MTEVVREVKAIVGSLGRTDDTVQAGVQLTGLASQMPSRSGVLAATWQSDLGFYRPHSAKSVVTTEQRIIGALYRLVDENQRPVSGPGSTTSTPPTPNQGNGDSTTPVQTPTSAQGTSGTPAPLPTPSPDSVRIQNATDLALVVTVYLDDSQNPQPYITETIPAQGSTIALFNFGTATGAFMTMNVSRADGLPSPAPFNNIDLSQPLGGYNGTLFAISLLGPYFNVNFS